MPVLRGFQLIHHQEASRHLPLGRLRFAALFAEGDWRMTDGLVEQTAKRSQALKAYFETNIRNSQIVSTQ
jgi:hypothetical protein